MQLDYHLFSTAVFLRLTFEVICQMPEVKHETTAQTKAADPKPSTALGSISLFLSSVQTYPKNHTKLFPPSSSKTVTDFSSAFWSQIRKRNVKFFWGPPHPGWGSGGEGGDQCYQLHPEVPGWCFLIPSPRQAALPWQLTPAQPRSTQLCQYPSGNKGKGQKVFTV